MPDSMHAVMITEIGKTAEMADVPVPAPEEGKVLVKTWCSGVSIGTEMWIATGRRLEGRTVPFLNAGYQVTGEVAAVGPGVESVSVGDAVVAFCSHAHSQYVVAGAAMVHALPSPDAARHASLFVMPSVAAHAINHAGVTCGDTVLVVGQGLIGQSIAKLCRLRGAYVIASEVSPQRIEVSREHCADMVIDATKGKVSEQLAAQFPGGADVVFESTGFNALVEDAMECVRSGGLNPGGTFVFAGWYPDEVSYTFQVPHSKQLTACYPAFIGEAPSREGVIRLIASGVFDMEPHISHTVPWTDAASVYNTLFTEERNSYNGIVFDWTA